MSKKLVKSATDLPRDRIIKVATDLFYRQGYRATGINEVIEKSGVAKATFYSHFPSKEDLGLAYLQQVKEGEIAHLEKYIRSAKGPRERYYAVIRSLEPWLLDTKFRGCAFINMVSETPDPKHPLRKVGREVYDYTWARVETQVKELIASDKKKFGHLNTRELTGEYMTAFVGAIALAEIYHAVWPVEDALNTACRLIGEIPG